MKKKSLVLLFLALVLVFVTACSSDKKGNEGKAPANGDEKVPRIALITPEKVGVNPFFQIMDDGIQKAAELYNVEVKTIESTDPNNIEENLRVAVADKYDLIITSTFQMVDALTKVATENPNSMFLIIDDVVDLPNVRSAIFREEEAAYLLGAAAGLGTKTNTVGLIIADDIPIMKKFWGGFEQGAAATNPEIKVLKNFVGSFTDPAKGKELAILQHSQNADYIGGFSAVSDLGVFEAAKEKGFYTSGQDVDRTLIDPEHIIMSQLKRADNVIIDNVRDFVKGSFEPGIIDYGLKEDGVGIIFSALENEYMTEEVKNKVAEIREDIVAGKVVVKDPLKD